MPLRADVPTDAIGAVAPSAPATLADTGLTVDGLSALLLKWLYGGEATGTQLADRLRVPYSILEGLIQSARAERLVEVRGASGAGSAGYGYALTDLGRDRAQQHLDVCRYVGPAPVPLAHYVSYMAQLADRRGHVDRERLAAGFSHLVVSPTMLEQLGPAINSRKAIFLYGPPGNGKTVIADGTGRVLGGDLYVPHAIDVDGQIITMFDPVNHISLETDAEDGLVRSVISTDRRWERIRRPVVTVGGELTLDMLDLRINRIAKFYEAPIQLKANGGVFVVDDFGRQRALPRDLLNRWIVPLETRIDYLTLDTGRTFPILFDALIIFATNLDPAGLADEAFLRRIPYKIYVKNPTFDEFTRIFESCCRRYNLDFDPVIVEYLHRSYYLPRRIEMRACHPRDLVEQVVNLCRFQNREPAITRDLLDAACTSYFLADTPQVPSTSGPRAGEDGAWA